MLYSRFEDISQNLGIYFTKIGPYIFGRYERLLYIKGG